ncbi:MAG: hypothetical protein WCO56_03365 [Verrucomicrobiota bacterium]
MKTSALLKPILALLGIFVFHANPVLGEVAFQNFDFESANIPNVPSGQSGVDELTLVALPGWKTMFGPYETTNVLHNTIR